jgi:hypothetical protein
MQGHLPTNVILLNGRLVFVSKIFKKIPCVVQNVVLWFSRPDNDTAP